MATVATWVLVFWINGQERAAMDHIEGFKTEAECRAAGELLTHHGIGIPYYGDDHFACIERRP